MTFAYFCKYGQSMKKFWPHLLMYFAQMLVSGFSKEDRLWSKSHIWGILRCTIICAYPPKSNIIVKLTRNSLFISCTGKNEYNLSKVIIFIFWGIESPILQHSHQLKHSTVKIVMSSTAEKNWKVLAYSLSELAQDAYYQHYLCSFHQMYYKLSHVCMGIPVLNHKISVYTLED